MAKSLIFAPHNSHLRPSRLQKYLIFFVFYLFCNFADAENRLGFSLGFGGTGIKAKALIEGNSYDADRSDSPLTIGITWEIPTSDTTSLSFDHLRGVQLSPFSSGVGFTGASWRWYYWGEIPSVSKKASDKTYIIITRRVYFAGLSLGVADGAIYRGGDLVPSTTASGIYYGLRGGYDLQVIAGQVLRTELFYAKTPDGAGFVKSSLSAFSLHAGWVYIY